MSNPRLETNAYRIWGYCKGIHWECTAQEVADALGLTYGEVCVAIRYKKFGGRLKSARHHASSHSGHPGSYVDQIDGENYRRALKVLGVDERVLQL